MARKHLGAPVIWVQAISLKKCWTAPKQIKIVYKDDLEFVTCRFYCIKGKQTTEFFNTLVVRGQWT